MGFLINAPIVVARRLRRRVIVKKSTQTPLLLVSSEIHQAWSGRGRVVVAAVLGPIAMDCTMSAPSV